MAVGYDSDAEGATNGAGLGGSFGEKLVSSFFSEYFFMNFQKSIIIYQFVTILLGPTILYTKSIWDPDVSIVPDWCHK